MKIKTKEIRRMSEAVLNEKITEMRKELMKMNSQIAIGTIPESPGKVRQVKKTIARMLTILSEKEKLPKEAKKKVKTKEESKKQ